MYQEPAYPESVTDNMVILTAVTGKQLATWDKSAGHGLFTHHLLDALYGKGDADGDGEVTAREAKAYLDRYMTANAWLHNKRHQNAMLTTRRLEGLALASVGAGGEFPQRPGFAGSGVVSGTPSLREEAEAELLKLTDAEKKLVQQGLLAAEHDIGAADGKLGRRTETGIRAFQKEMGWPETGKLTLEQAEALMELGRVWQAERRRQEEAERLERERQQAAKEEEAERLERERQRTAKEEAERLERERQQAAKEEAEAERLERERQQAAKKEAERLERERQQAAKKEAERLERERQQAAKEEAERLDRERQQAAKEEAERLKRGHRKTADPGDHINDCPESECPMLVVVPPGTFQMASGHRVTIGESIAVGVYEVTFSEWDACHREGRVFAQSLRPGLGPKRSTDNTGELQGCTTVHWMVVEEDGEKVSTP